MKYVSSVYYIRQLSQGGAYTEELNCAIISLSLTVIHIIHFHYLVVKSISTCTVEISNQLAIL
jgi:hypothetical protein